MTTSADRTSPPFSPYGTEALRRAGGHFIAGFVGNALFALITTILIARWLTPRDYAVYTLLSSIVLLLGVISSLGLREAAQRFLPELVVQNHPDSRSLLGVILAGLLGVTFLSLMIAAGIFYLATPRLAETFHMEHAARSFHLACLMLVFSHLFLFSCLMLETFMRQACVKWLVICLALLRLILVFADHTLNNGLPLNHVLMIEIFCHAVFLIPALAVLFSYVRIPHEDPKNHIRQEIELTLGKRIIPFAAYNYLMILALAFQGGAVNKIVVGAMLPATALALFGFAQTLSDLIQRYLPNTLLLSIVRPAVMAHWTRSRDWEALARFANLFFKVNMFLLLPVLSWLALCGEPLAAILSGGKYRESGHLLFGLSCLLVLQCHNRRYELILQALEHSQILFRGNLFVVVFILPSAWLTQFMGPWGIVLGTFLGMACRDVFTHWSLARFGAAPGFDFRAWGGLILAAVLSGLIVHPFLPAAPGLVHVSAAGPGCLLVFLILAALLRPFNAWERRNINQLLGRPVFIW